VFLWGTSKALKRKRKDARGSETSFRNAVAEGWRGEDGSQVSGFKGTKDPQNKKKVTLSRRGVRRIYPAPEKGRKPSVPIEKRGTKGGEKREKGGIYVPPQKEGREKKSKDGFFWMEREGHLEGEGEKGSFSSLGRIAGSVRLLKNKIEKLTRWMGTQLQGL